MKIQKINLSNFRNFIEQEINFSTDDKKRFTVVLGDNTFGKTTLIRAFLWCLYRENYFDEKILLNKDIESSLSYNKSVETSVRVSLTHNDFEYEVVTREVYGVNSSHQAFVITPAVTKVFKTDSFGECEVLKGKDAEDEINNILRREFKDYFFFDGETNTIEKIGVKKNLSDAVSTILDIKKIETLRDYYANGGLDTVRGYLSSKLVSQNDILLGELNDKKDELIAKIKDAEKNNANSQIEIDKIDEEIAKKEQILDANKEIEKKQREKKELDQEIISLEEKCEKDYGCILKTCNTNFYLVRALFAYAYKSAALSEKLSKSSFTSADSLKGISEEAVDQLIQRGYCICGAKIESKNDAYNHLIASKEHMQPRDFGKHVSDFISSEETNISLTGSNLESLLDLTDETLNLIETIEKDKVRLNDIKKEISGSLDVGSIQDDINNLKEQKINLGNAIASRNGRIESYKEQLNEINKEIDKNTKNTSGNYIVKKAIKYAEKIYDDASAHVDLLKNKSKEDLEKKVNEIFQSVYSGGNNRVIRISNRFNTHMYTSDNKTVEMSTGLKTVMNYAFVAGLINLTKSAQHNEEFEDDFIADNNYPLVMDAPFSALDANHVAKVCLALSEYCDQMVIFVMDKDYSHAANALKGKVGKIYEIKKINETNATVELIREE